MTNLAILAKASVAAVIAAILLITGCSDDPTSSPPEEEEESYTLLSSDTIGSDGGIIETVGFSLTIPAGALAADYELQLYASSTDHPFGDHGVSRMFRVEGFPAAYSQPLEVRINYEGSLSRESHIVLGENLFISSLSDTTTAYQLLPATDSSGWLIGEVPAPSSPSTSRRSRMNSPGESGLIHIILGALSNSGYVTSADNHFQIRYPWLTVDAADVEALAGFLEEAYRDFRDSLKFDYSARILWPVRVVVGPFFRNPNAFGWFSCSRLGNNFGWMEFNSAKMSDHALIRSTAGHEFFHLVQSLYDSRSSRSKARTAPPHHWLNEAAAVWSERMFNDQPNSAPAIFSGNEYEPMRGMHHLVEWESAEATGAHGYGMSAVMTYLLDTYGDSCLLKMYQGVRAGLHPVEAVTSVVGQPSEWLEAFFRAYTLGSVYGMSAQDVTSGLALVNPFYIQSPDDTLRVFSRSYQDISAELYEIRLRYANMADSLQLTFSLAGGGGNAQISVFRNNSTTIELLTSTALGNPAPQVTIANVREDFIDNGWHLLALVTNNRAVSPYAGKTDMNLTVRLEPAEFNICNLYVRVLNHYHDRYYNSNGKDTTEDFSHRISFKVPFVGGFSGATFTGRRDTSYVDSAGNYRAEQGELTAVLDANRERLISLNWSIATHLSYDSANIYTETSFIGGNIPVLTDLPTILYCRANGAEACNSISSYDYTFTYDYQNQGYHEARLRNLTGYTCEPDSSWIQVSFKRE